MSDVCPVYWKSEEKFSRDGCAVVGTVKCTFWYTSEAPLQIVSTPVLAGQDVVGAPGCMQNLPDGLAICLVSALVDSLTVTLDELVLVTEKLWLDVVPGFCWMLNWLRLMRIPPWAVPADWASLTAAAMLSRPAPCCD